MNVIKKLENFHTGTLQALSLIQKLKQEYPSLFNEVLPEDSDIRMGDVLQGLLNAESELSKSLDLVGTDLEVD
ncbi:MAG: hypothetical protein MJK14_18545 [Rivularia sp. ALOHA_DT_140]|nr:hypothetical protein [Rivularia sp. ALOHA_DT_140]